MGSGEFGTFTVRFLQLNIFKIFNIAILAFFALNAIMKIKRALIAAAAMLLGAGAQAFVIDNASIKNKRTFGIEFPDGTSYYGMANAICGISKQQYVVGGVMMITEVSIDMAGASTQIRIYHAKPIDSEALKKLRDKLPQELKPYTETPKIVQEQLDRADAAMGKAGTPMVSKDYPMTTHAKTIEFVVDSLDEILLFYDRFSSDFTGKIQKLSSKNSENEKNNSDIELGIEGKVYRIQSGQDYSAGAILRGEKNSTIEERKN